MSLQTGLGATPLGLAGRLDEITGAGAVNARAIIAEPGTGRSQFPPPGTPPPGRG